MGKKNFSQKDLIDLLIKKANGFYYTEEIFEYEKSQKTSKQNENIEQKCKNINFFDVLESNNTNASQGKNVNDNDKKLKQQISQDLALSKKKTSTHFVPPDMLAIKILFEIFEKKIDGTDIEKLTDKELIELKNKLIMELTNDSKNNNWKNEMWYCYM